MLALGVAVKEKLSYNKSPLSYAIFIYRQKAQPFKQKLLGEIPRKTHIVWVRVSPVIH